MVLDEENDEPVGELELFHLGHMDGVQGREREGILGLLLGGQGSGQQADEDGQPGQGFEKGLGSVHGFIPLSKAHWLIMISPMTRWVRTR